MNAKERRKLRRATEASQASEAEVKKEEVTVDIKKEEPQSFNENNDEDFIKLPSLNDEPVKKVKAEKKVKVEPQQSTPLEGSGDAGAENAKSRRLAKRAAEREEQTAPAAQEEVDAQTAEANNSKSRRLAMRAAKRLASTGAEESNNSGENGENNGAANAKARRLEKRAAERAQQSEEPPKKVPKRKLKDPNAKSIHLTLFLGQLPFDATEDLIRKHFSEAGEIKVRMLTDKKTKKFKGTAFIEVADSKALGAALARHHSLMNGRRINVELTANGGGTKSELRQTRIKELREKQKVKQVEKVHALLQKNVDDPECKLTQDDVDERMTDFLSWFDYDTAKLALEEFNRCVSDRVLNRRAFFMGILKRFRTTDGVEDDRPPRGNSKGDKFKKSGPNGRPNGRQGGSRPPFKRARHE